MKLKRKNSIFKKIKNDYLLVVFFIISNLINSTLFRIITIKKAYNVSPLLMDLSFLIIVSLISLLIKRKNRIKYFLILSIIFSLICIINSTYYHYYNSFASFSLLSNITFAKDVSDAIFEDVLKVVDLIYLWAPIALIFIYKYLKKKNYFKNEISDKKKKLVGRSLIVSITLLIISSIIMPISSWSRLYKLWNRESVVINYGIYIYQTDDFIQSLTPKINSAFGHDNALKKTKDYYEENKFKKSNNEYTNIFEEKNILVVHAESLQTFTMNLNFNGEDVTPNLNKLSKEGIFFNNFYSEVGVGTSSDTEFTFNTSLMPSTKGTVFVSYFDREYISMPKLLKEKGYYTFSMHGNDGDFWNRNVMHKNLGYDNYYSKDSYEIDEEIGLGLSDKSFFRQSVNKIKEITNNQNAPYYGTLITLTNHTPFNDLELMSKFDTSIKINLDNEKITRNYLNNTEMGNYLTSVHYADEALGEFINDLDKEGLLDNTILIIYGDHDARLDFDEFNLLYNYDPISDKILQDGDEGYIPYNEYNYELDRKVPLIIWSKEKEFNKTVDIPMGMIDVLPTIGNMLGINSDYQLGKDIFELSTNDNTVTFIDGSFLTSKIYYNYPKEEIYLIKNEAVTEEYINKNIEYSTKLIEISNDIIFYNLIKEMEVKQND